MVGHAVPVGVVAEAATVEAVWICVGLAATAVTRMVRAVRVA